GEVRILDAAVVSTLRRTRFVDATALRHLAWQVRQLSIAWQQPLQLLHPVLHHDYHVARRRCLIACFFHHQESTAICPDVVHPEASGNQLSPLDQLHGRAWVKSPAGCIPSQSYQRAVITAVEQRTAVARPERCLATASRDLPTTQLRLRKRFDEDF